MQEPEVEFRAGCPSVAHVEAALRLGLEWRCGIIDYVDYHYRMVVNDGEVCVDCEPYVADKSMRPYGVWVKGARIWRPCRPDGAAVAWSVLDEEVARHEAAKAAKLAATAPPPEVEWRQWPDAATPPSVAVAAQPDWRDRRPTDDEIRAHQIGHGGRWVTDNILQDEILLLGLDAENVARGWWTHDFTQSSGSGWRCTETHKDRFGEARRYYPVDSTRKPVPWPTPSSVEAKTMQPSLLTPRLAVGDVVVCSSFKDGEAGVRVETADAQQRLERNLGVGVVEAVDAAKQRCNVRSIATDEVHTWPCSALEKTETWGLKVGDVVVTPRFEDKAGLHFRRFDLENKRGRISVIHPQSGSLMTHGCYWPIEDVARATVKEKLRKMSSTTEKLKNAAATTAVGRVPTAEEIDAHDKAHGGRWRGNRGGTSLWLRDGQAFGWVSEDGDRPSYAWCLSDDSRHDFVVALNLQPIDAASNVVPWPIIASKQSGVDFSPTPSKLPRDGDAMTVEGAVAVAEEGARRAMLKMLTPRELLERVRACKCGKEMMATEVTLASSEPPHNRRLTFTCRTCSAQVTENVPLHTTQETTMPTNNPTTTNPTTQPSIIDELKEDAHELGYRLAASETVEITRDVLVDLLTAEVSEREQSMAKEYAREMLSSKAGLALVGLAASFGLPAVAKAVDRGDDPRVLRLARECRREGAMPGLKLLAGKLRALLVGAGSRLLGVFDKLPAEDKSIDVTERRVGALPTNVSPELGDILSGGARCRTTA